MDIFVVLFVSCITFLIGIIVTLVVQYYLLYSYFKKSPVVKPPQRQSSIDYSLPDALKKQLENEDEKNKANLPVSLILQFLFHELRHSESIKRWLYKKLSLEFEELLTKTTIGKFFETITIKDMNLGNQFPDIKEISIGEVKLDDKEGHIDLVSLCLNLDYTGNFLLSVDAKMKFGKTAYLSIKVKKISGRARLQFTRHPYTHWSFSFFNDPVLDLAVESHFQGRQLQSNITNLIVNQIKKAIKRKHTLPNYKIRYKPFFVKTDPSQLDLEDSEIVPQGQLDLTCVEISRLEYFSEVQNIYCTVSVDTIPWICLYNNDDTINMILEITISKLRQAQLGVIFRQEQGCVVVENVSPHSCASRSGIKAGDVVLAVENKPVNSVPQIAKFIKSISSANITLRIERVADSYIFKNRHTAETKTDGNTKISSPASDTEESELIQTEQDSFIIIDTAKQNEAQTTAKKKSVSPNLERCKTPEKVPKIIGGNENMSKFAQTIGNFSLRKRKTSVSSIGDKTSNENSARNTPNSSVPGTPQHGFKQHSITIPSSILTAKKHSISEVPEIIRTSCANTESADGVLGNIEIVKGKEMPSESVIVLNEDFQFNLKTNMKYLNINVWGCGSGEKDVLLGYANIPLSHILNECCGSVLGHYMRSYSFLPPNLSQPAGQPHPLTSHSGFEHVFCYGDILLSFVWTHEDDIEVKPKMSSSGSDTDVKPSDHSSASAKHDFIRTQFHRTTHCDFCTKKIWLKDAVQCRECGLCCHKKCIAKCQMSTGCVPGERKPPDEHVSHQPEITMTEPCEEISSEGSFTENCLKRVNSANNLAIPGLNMPTISKSLPPSPQRTPSRKQSLAENENPFALCPWALEEVQKQPNEASESVNRLLDQVMLCPPDESLMDAAKETGQQLYANMPHEERVEKINVMMTELKKTLDAVTMEHMELSKQMSAEECESEKTKIAFLMGKADAKVHGLSVLMLHYCSSLQHTQEKII